MLTHINEQNSPMMVDVSGKSETARVAVASGKIKMSQQAYETVISGLAKKGAVLHTATIAAIMGAKKTGELIPMCHPLMLSKVECDIAQLPELPGFKLLVTVKCEGKTGVEMEALTGVGIGLLTIYDMVKAVDKSMVIFDVALEYKEGGKSGVYEAAKNAK